MSDTDQTIEPCLIHEAVRAWLNYDFKRYFPKKKGQHGFGVGLKGRKRISSDVQARIKFMRSPGPDGKPLFSQNEVAAECGVSLASVKFYQ